MSNLCGSGCRKSRLVGLNRPSRSSSSKSRSRSKSNDSLDKIAEEKIGDEDLTIEQGEDDESIIGEVKKRAKDQGRDPAIDPDLQGGS